MDLHFLLSLPRPAKKATPFVRLTVLSLLLVYDQLHQEPHPADDLNGFDVARKLTILSRTISAFSSTATSHLLVLQSFKSVQTTSLIPPALEGSPTGDDFISCLPEFDEQFAQLRTEANAQGKVLRFVGVIDVQTGQAKAGLEK